MIVLSEKWDEKEPSFVDRNENNYSVKRGMLFFSLSTDLCEKIEAEFMKVIKVTSSDLFKVVNSSHIEMDFQCEEHFSQLVNELKTQSFAPDIIVNAVNLCCPCRERMQGVYLQFYIAKYVLKRQCDLFYLFHKGEESYLDCGITGMNKVIENENLDIKTHCVEVDDINVLGRYFIENELSEEERYVKYEDGMRYVRTLKEKELISEETSFLFEGKTFLIIGGLGGLGNIFTRYLLSFDDTNVILCGRRIIDSLELNADYGLRVSYFPCDVTKQADVDMLVNILVAKNTTVDFILCMAGTIKDSLIVNKKIESFKSTIEPKLMTLKRIPLFIEKLHTKNIVLFSSISSVVGTRGQADYSFANAVLNYFADLWENKKCEVLSLAWPLWDSQGLQADDRMLALMKKQGFSVLSEEEGTKIFRTLISQLSSREFIIFQGNNEKIREVLKIETKAEVQVEKESKMINVRDNNVVGKVREYIKNTIASVTQHDFSEISDYDDFDTLGIDSVKMMAIIEGLEEKLGELPKTLFFEYQSVNQLVDFVVQGYEDLFVSTNDFDDKTSVEEKRQNLWEDEDVELDIRLVSEDESLDTAVDSFSDSREPIAIVGMSGRFPQAENIDEFWQNLLNGKDCIVEIPKERWDYNDIYVENNRKIGKSNSKWGGFIDGMEEFDAEFFKYSPIEAVLIDPQERLFLETVWNTMEDAGYTRKNLKNERAGVFVGASWGHYQFMRMEYEGNEFDAISSFSSIANRVSYFLNLTGPSISVDTMCSSSGTAIHLACESIWNNESTIAFAGGVNLTIGETKYRVLSAKNYLSSEGKCRSFGEGGDGYVPGEGIGCVLLKPLSAAVKDGNHIEGVILATGVNHGGRSTGYSVPNVNAQAELIERTLQKGHILSEDITYIEAHGTGTSLGDPVEILGLARGLHIKENEGVIYDVGSVKSNVGHLESAAAVAALIKVVMQMKNKVIVPSLHSEELNKKIDFEHLPFHIPQEKEAIIVKESRRKNRISLISTVSSFGAGGSNTFIVVGKYEREADYRNFENKSNIVVLSAINKNALKKNVEKLYDFLQRKEEISANELVDICFTLQMGREEMKERVAFVIESAAEIKSKLYSIMQDEKRDDIYWGSAHADMRNQKIEYSDNLNQVAKLWAEGYFVEWRDFYKYEESQPRLVSLPTYSFQKKRYWIEDFHQIEKNNKSRELQGLLIDYNYSTLERQLYAKKINTSDAFLSNHVVNGKKILPGAVYLEIARQACSMALTGIGNVLGLKNVVFEKAFTADDANENLYIELFPRKKSVDFEIKSEQSEKVFCTGSAMFGRTVLNAASIQESKFDFWNKGESKKELSKEESYQYLKVGGFDYGIFYQSIEKISLLEDCIIAKVSLGDEIDSANMPHVLKPSIIDGAMQTMFANFDLSENTNRYLPHKIDELYMYGELTKQSTVVNKIVSKGSNYIANLYIYDDKGDLVVRICGYTVVGLNVDSVRKAEVKKEVKHASEKEIRNKLKSYVYGVIARETAVDISSIHEDDDFEKFGIDSVMFMRITERLNEVFGGLPATLLYEYKKIDALLEYLNSEYEDILNDKFGSITETMNEEVVDEKIDVIQNKTNKASRKNRKRLMCNSGEDIAIIGIDGRYPKADNLKQYWENLRNGVDCVSEIPIERWDYRPFYSPDKNAKGKIYSKWGGFINGVEEFDAEFFGIVPLQAIVMDPQERIYLQTAWHCVEDAGYSLESLADYTVGVYTGEMWGDYQKIGVEETLKGNTVSLSSSYASTSNKVSYIMNLHGPSMTIDTMCSSSLTAIDLACNALHDGSIDMAIAGGVNLTLHPDKYISLCQGKFLSSEGKCRAFGEGGDGYVPSEGVGAVLLKRVTDAEQDGDHIYAVIKATSINHGGKSNAYFVPNVEEQRNLIVSALEKADISPRTISSVEAHGTGTPLGDPIEVAGFNKAYRNYTSDVKYCSLGSVKSNIGHCESAAGIAAISKIVLEMQHKKLVPSLHSQVLNSKINFENSPFYVQHVYEDWKKPVIIENGNETIYPRRAAVSAFGAGGTNVHIILEEYTPEDNFHAIGKEERLFVISAKKVEQLRELLKSYVAFLENKEFENEQQENSFLVDLQGTMIKGREELNARIAILASSVKEILLGIKAYLSGQKTDKYFVGSVGTNSAYMEMFNDEDGQIYINMLIDKKHLSKLAQMWVKGVRVGLQSLIEHSYNKISLPLYPFEKIAIGIERISRINNGVSRLHAVIDQNISTIHNQSFCKLFDGNEFYLADHTIGNKSILPGVVYLEMFKAAAELAVDNSSAVCIRNIVWKKPFLVEQNQAKAIISLKTINDAVVCSLESVNIVGTHELCSVGEVELVEKNDDWVSSEKVSVSDFKNKCKILIHKKDFYEKLTDINIEYGDRMQGIHCIYVSSEQKKAYVQVENLSKIAEAFEFSLHPMVLDAGVQAVATLITEEKKAYLPYSIGKVDILGDSVQTKYILIEKIGKGVDTVSFNLEYVDEMGKILVRFHELAVKEQKIQQGKKEIHYYTTEIVEVDIPNIVNKDKGLIIFAEDAALWQEMHNQYPTCILVARGTEFKKLDASHYQCVPGNEQSYINVIKEVLSFSENFNTIIYHSPRQLSKEDRMNYGAEIFSIIKAILLSGSNRTIQFIHVFSGSIGSSKVMNIDPIYLACAGLFKTAVAESGKLRCKNIAIDYAIDDNPEDLCSLLVRELDSRHNNVEESFYKSVDSKYSRAMLEISPEELQQENSIPLHKSGVYIITGGLKGVGYIFAKHIAKTYGSTILLFGRSKLDANAQKKLKDLQAYGSRTEYYTVDVNDKNQVDVCLKEIRGKYKIINGIIHSAGVKKDELIINKTKNTFVNTITTKVKGLENLCELTSVDKLDFVVAFSSIAGIMGNIGQADYSYANNFMDAYAFMNRMKNKKIITINWPYWKNGGMKLRQADIDNMRKNNGMLPLLTEDGISAFECLLGSMNKYVHTLVLPTVIKERGSKKVEKTGRGKINKHKKIPELATTKSPRENAEIYIKNIISDETKIIVSKINSDDNFEVYGFDSVVTMNMVARLDEDFSGISKTIFYEVHNVSELVDYLISNYEDVFDDLFGECDNEEQIETDVDSEKNVKLKKITFETLTHEDSEVDNNQEIAIVAIHVKTAEAENIAQLWQNLVDAKNCMSTIPKERFEYEKYYCEKPGEIGKTYCSIGGFMDGVENFDPLFFHVAPNNAVFMDPLERLLLEAVWYLFENAGYSVSNLEKRDVGVFIGAMWQQYQMLLMNGPAQGMIPSLFSNLSNRISGYYDLNGPSVSVDTMCSSSLTALQMAINSIKAGECSSAIVGGINLSLHQSKYINLSQGRLLSHGTRSIPFGKGADGYLPSEGLGLVLVKPLSEAIKDNDNILCIIKSSAILHSGKGSGYMIPNLKMQTEVIKKACEKVNVPIESIGYIEAQGICTEVGDAMEFSAINNAYKHFTDQRHFCALGSAKYSIGHTEAASGIMAIAKIIMQMKNHMITGLLKEEEINESLDLTNSSLYIPKKNIPWNSLDQNGIRQPLRAGLNGFGGAGTYTHFILEEYIEPVKRYCDVSRENAFILSARTEKALFNNVVQFKDYLNKMRSGNLPDAEKAVKEVICHHAGFLSDSIEKTTLVQELALSQQAYLKILGDIRVMYAVDLSFDEITKFVSVGDFVDYIVDKISSQGKSEGVLDDIAYTLQTGRDSMQHKIVFVAEKYAELMEVLDDYINMTAKQEIVKSENDKKSIKNAMLKSLVEEWLKGNEVKWKAYYKDRIPKKMQLPNYVFDNQKYWIPKEYIVDMSLENIYSKKDSIDGEMKLGEESLSLEEKVSGIIAEELGIDKEEIGYDVDLKEYGMESFIAQRVFMRISEICNIALSFSMFEEGITIRKICASKCDEIENVMDVSESKENKSVSQPTLEMDLLLRLQRGDVSVEEALFMEGKDE